MLSFFGQRFLLCLPVFQQTMTQQNLEYSLGMLRDRWTSRPLFRSHIRSIGEILGQRIAKTMPRVSRNVTAAIAGPQFMYLPREQPVLVYVERAGRELYFGLQRAFPDATSGVIAAARDEETLESAITYAALPELKDQEVIVADTMIATGGSMVQALDLIRQHDPKRIQVAGVIASKHAMQVLADYDRNLRVHVAAVDPELDEHGYIQPGLGDAGDRCYGKKL